MNLYIDPNITISKFETENVVATTASALQVWQGQNTGAQVRTLNFEDLSEMKGNF